MSNDVVVSVAQLCESPTEGALLIASDLEIFTDLAIADKKKVYGAIKRIQPHPEFKSDHEWLVTWMKEDLDASIAEATVPEVTKMIETIAVGEAPVVVTKFEEQLEGFTAPVVALTAPSDVTPVFATNTDRDAYIFKLRSEGFKLKEIGERVGLSGVRISRILGGK